MFPFLDVLMLALIFIALSGLRIAQEYERGVIFRLGRYKGLRGPGLYWIIPLNIERSVRVDIRTRTVSAEQQETITRDSVTIKVNAVLWYRIVDSSKSVIEVADAPAAVYQLALTGLRNIIGQHDLDEILQERNKINTLLGDSISGSTAAWGLEVQRFEMKDVELPQAMQQVMAMQAEAIREKRARIIKAEAELEASVKLSAAGAQISANPAALELRRMQMISEVGAENNSTTVLMIPSDFVSLAHNLNDYLLRRVSAQGAPASGRHDAAIGRARGRPYVERELKAGITPDRPRRDSGSRPSAGEGPSRARSFRRRRCESPRQRAVRASRRWRSSGSTC